MKKDDLKRLGVEGVETARSVSHDLIEKALAMRCLSYLSNVKSRLLTETIFEMNSSRMLLKVAKNRVENQFHQSQKMEALGILVGGIAHDFNNMLTGITGNVYLARKEGLTLEALNRRLDNIEQVSYQAAEMIQQLLAFARKSEVSMAPMNLNAFIKEAGKLFESSIPENIHLSVSVSSEEMIVKGDPTQLQQVLLNLLTNACFAVKKSLNPSISIELKPYISGVDFKVNFPAHFSSNYAHIRVKDNGSGIPESLIDKIFEPFFTTKKAGEGTGLGLPMVYGAIENHKGIINVSSDPETGTEFNIFLPLIEGQCSVEDEKYLVVDGNGKMILLVDDEELVLKIEAELLTSMNYQVITAKDGLEALRMYEKHREEISMLISDVVMPNLGGLELARAIRKQDSKLPIILCSGYDRSKNMQSSSQKEGYALLKKPFRVQELSAIIHQMI